MCHKNDHNMLRDHKAIIELIHRGTSPQINLRHLLRQIPLLVVVSLTNFASYYS